MKGECTLKQGKKAAEPGMPTLGQRIMKSHTSYLMLAPFAILFLVFIHYTGYCGNRTQLYKL